MWSMPSAAAMRHIVAAISQELAPSSTSGIMWQCTSTIAAETLWLLEIPFRLEQFAYVFHFTPLRLRYGGMGDVAAIGIHAFANAIVRFHCALYSFLCQLHHIRQSGVSERQGGRMRHRRRHVGNAVVHHAVHCVRRIAVCGRPSSFDAP